MTTDRETRSAKRMEGVKTRQAADVDRLNAQINAANAAFEDLPSAASFLHTLQVPSDLTPAMLTNRPELVKLAKPRPLTADECKMLYALISDLMETNAALRRHAQEVARLADNWLTAFTGLGAVGHRIAHFANFEKFETEESDNGE
jgi:hypothetical protein